MRDEIELFCVNETCGLIVCSEFICDASYLFDSNCIPCLDGDLN